MKLSHLVLLGFVAGIVGVGLLAGNALSGTPRAADPGPAAWQPGNGPTVVAIDLSKVLKEHNGFKARMEAMAAEVKAAETDLNTQRTTIQKMEETMAKPTSTSPKPGSPEYKKMEEDIMKMKSDFNVKASVQKKDLMEKETKIYYNAYKEVVDQVKSGADYYKISMVLRYNSDVLDVPAGTPPNREEVAKLLAKPIVYLGPGLDITNQIIASINSRYPAPGGTNTAKGPVGPSSTTPR